MRKSRFYLLLAVTAAMVLLALALLLIQPTREVAQDLQRPAFPLLAEAPDTAALIEVIGSQGSYRLARTSAAALWLLPDKGGYPADSGDAAKLLRGLAGLSLFQAKTSKPENLALLGLAGPEAGPGQGPRLIVSDAAGAPLVDALIGKVRADIGEEGTAGTYLRYSGSDQAWLAKGEIRLPDDSLGMLDRRLTSLPGSVVARIEITPPDSGADLVVERPLRGASDLALQPPPMVGESVNDLALRQLSDALDRLDFRDVRPAEDLPLPQPWARALHLLRRYPGDLDLSAAGGEAMGAHDRRCRPGDRSRGGRRPNQEVAAFAARLAARTDGWVYRLDPLVFPQLAVRRDAVVAPSRD